MTEEEIVKNIEKLAEENGYDLNTNVKSIARIKARQEDWKTCPCDPNSDRGCISAHCKEDIERDGICHCHLYKKRQ